MITHNLINSEKNLNQEEQEEYQDYKDYLK